MFEAAQQCVKCGLCLAVCPTYQHSLNEADSPRGRLALLQDLTSGRAYIERCLYCGACQRVCPSKVPYLALMDEAKSQLGSRAWQAGLLHWLSQGGLAQPWLKYGIHRLPNLKWGKTFTLAPPAQPKGKLLLAVGCSGYLEADTVQAAIDLLQASGYEVMLSNQCCGALAAHSGLATEAEQLKQAYQQRFAASGAEQVISFTSGCGAYLKSYLPHQDIASFLFKQDLSFKPLPISIALHQPCTLKQMQVEQATVELLRKIPQLQLNLLQGECCGAGGLKFLSSNALSRELKQALLKQLGSVQLGLSSNLACRLHLSLSRSRLKWLHPIKLLQKQLKR